MSERFDYREENDSCSRRFRHKVRKCDQFGIPAQLNINRQATHNTCIGGTCSIFAVIVLGIYTLG